MNRIVFTPGLSYSGNLPDGRKVDVVRGENEEQWSVMCDGNLVGLVSDRAEMEHRFGVFTEVEVVGE